jgi:hypothetical protein
MLHSYTAQIPALVQLYCEFISFCIFAPFCDLRDECVGDVVLMDVYVCA